MSNGLSVLILGVTQCKWIPAFAGMTATSILVNRSSRAKQVVDSHVVRIRYRTKTDVISANAGIALKNAKRAIHLHFRLARRRKKEPTSFPRTRESLFEVSKTIHSLFLLAAIQPLQLAWSGERRAIPAFAGMTSLLWCAFLAAYFPCDSLSL